MNKEKITLIAAGDVMLHGDATKDIFHYVRDVLRSGDITFGNCEQTYSDKGNPVIGQTSNEDPNKSINTLIDAGFDVLSIANNHTLDAGYEALLDTIERMNKTNIKLVGIGKNLAVARQPVIIEKKGNRVGFLAYGCIGPDGYEAWEDKPGYAPMRAYTIYDKWDYQPGTPPRIITVAYPDDLAVMEEDIRKLKSQVDVVAVSLHWGLHFQHAVIPMYGFQVGHAAIDAGADIILGGHAHILKGIEVYKGKVVFHALNNFAFGMRRRVPTATPPGGDPFARGARRFSEMYHFTPEPGSIWHPEAKRTLIGKVIIEDGKIKKVSYLPCWIDFQKEQQPELLTRSDPRAQDVFSYMEQISREEKLSTKYAWEGDEIVISA
jgi:poly-gamma-glutamate capsule biosynthesis protein CapA/YwtB (metallophosphatase superfamily)